MSRAHHDPAEFPRPLRSRSGLAAQINANGSIRRLHHAEVTLNLFVGDEIEGGPANVYLRRRGSTIEALPLLGPRSRSSIGFDGDRLLAFGEWWGVRYRLSLTLAESAPAWFWHVELENAGERSATLDLVYVQDTALAHYGAIRLNEYYVSQYVDHTPLEHATNGITLAVRQNLAVAGTTPWAVIGSLGKGVGFATDALQIYGAGHEGGKTPAGLSAPNLPNIRRQHEHSMASLQDQLIFLNPGARASRGFFGWFEANHPAATSDADLAFVDCALALPEATPGTGTVNHDRLCPVAPSLFSDPRPLPARDLTSREMTEAFGDERRHVEKEDGRVLSFFTGFNAHVVLRDKELRVLRPHGHIIRTGQHLTPDESSLTSTLWMSGGFNSLLTQGHVSINRALSAVRSYLHLFVSGGQRIFVELHDGFHLLDTPSAFAMTPEGGRWVYKYAGGILEVACTAESHSISLSIRVRAGAARRFLISNRIALNGDDGTEAIPVQYLRDANGLVITAIAESDVGRRFPGGCFRFDALEGTHIERVGGDELLFTDGVSRNQPFLVIETGLTESACFRISGHLIPKPDRLSKPAVRDGGIEDHDDWVPFLVGNIRSQSISSASDILRVEEILPWFTHNALVHYLAPRGLEQFSGGGWGTRDICQGPVEWLLAFGHWEPLRDLLLRVFRTQNNDGDWPQWFTFFERDRGIRADDSHGDIVFWPLLALAQYLLATEDASILDEELVFFDPAGDEAAERATVWGHAERALSVIAKRVIPGTALAAYGHGDWNDSLQPADPAMRERLCSAWTVTLHYQTLVALSQALRTVGRNDDAATIAERLPVIRSDFQEHLMPDGTLAGFAYFSESGETQYLVHPRDDRTGMHFSLLAMAHALINDMLTPEEADEHVALIRKHLLAPDGARLFDRPPCYSGGPQTYFQRAESSTFFGREIGVMYMHAHLRYAEAMARLGAADAFFDALCLANPIAIRQRVPNASLRQANCYYSSSDAAFFDRYQASAHYQDVLDGGIAVEGGWRIYSSGAGIAARLIHQRLLGFELRRSVIVLDPVLPASLDGLEAEIVLFNRPVSVVYRIEALGCGPTTVTLNGTPLGFGRQHNPYRTGGALLDVAELEEKLDELENHLIVTLA